MVVFFKDINQLCNFCKQLGLKTIEA